LQHEFRVACKLSNTGCEITFSDLEAITRYDLIAECKGLQYEVEAKALSVFSGQSISPMDADKFLVDLRRKLDIATDDTGAVVIEVALASKLKTARNELEQLVAACNEVAKTQGELDIEGYARIRFISRISESLFYGFRRIMRLPYRFGQYSYIIDDHRRAIVSLLSEERDKFKDNIIASVQQACSQLTQTRPGIIWMHIDFISSQEFQRLNGFFTAIAEESFKSSRMKNVVQLVFSGGAKLTKSEIGARSGFEIMIYNSPLAENDAVMLLTGGSRTPHNGFLSEGDTRCLSLHRATDIS
jgi:hypothetical protein